ncbi:MAG: 3-demethoxyubiquinol 3-hydroxylase [Legionellaceae bacterium]
MFTSLSFLDKCLIQADQILRFFTMDASKAIPSREYPVNTTSDSEQTLLSEEKRLSGALMRINHTGEVCAQALYQGQALTARDDSLRLTMQQAAEEEIDHLIWCEKRLQELQSRPSHLNSVWYLGSLSMGIIAGIAGDKWSLGFLAETEQQVAEHLNSHLQQLPSNDNPSRQIVEQMKIDEQKHADTAMRAGAEELPFVVKMGMRMASKIMTSITYYL